MKDRLDEIIKAVKSKTDGDLSVLMRGREFVEQHQPLADATGYDPDNLDEFQEALYHFKEFVAKSRGLVQEWES